MSSEEIEVYESDFTIDGKPVIFHFTKIDDIEPKYIAGIKMDVYLNSLTEKNNIGTHSVYIDNEFNLHGLVAIVKAFTSENKEEKDTMKGLGKFMLCTMTRYLVDTYNIDTSRVYYGLAGGGTPYFDLPIHQVYHPKMCELTGVSVKELIYTTISSNGREIRPVLSEEELRKVVDEIDPYIDTETYDELKTIGEQMLESDKILFIKTCIKTIYPTTWKDIERNREKYAKELQDVSIESYYESIMCEIIATHRLFTFYENSLGFVGYNKKDGRLIRMKAVINDRLKKCNMAEKMF